MSESLGRKVEAALVVVVPEAEPLVGRFRAKYDPVAASGVPAHITINYPFLPGVEPTAVTLDKLSQLFGGVAPFSFTLDHVGRFPNSVYLAPVPAIPFIELIKQVASEFPESPPYGGVFDSMIPHLTVAYANDGVLLASIEHDLSNSASRHLPIDSFANNILLLDDSTGRWETRASFALG